MKEAVWDDVGGEEGIFDEAVLILFEKWEERSEAVRDEAIEGGRRPVKELSVHQSDLGERESEESRET